MANELTPARTVACPSGQADHVGDLLWKKDGWPMYRCRSCAHMWVFPLPSDAELKAFYDRGYFQGETGKRGYSDYDRDKESVRDDFITSLMAIERVISPGRLVDVGAATGFFCRLAQERGWRATGIELSAYAAQVGCDRGLDIREGTFETYAEELAGVDAITAWDVIEHLQDPYAFLRRAHDALRPGGVLMGALPQGDSWFARLLGKRWTLLAPPQHLHYFSRASLYVAFEAAGFTIESIEWRGKDFCISYIIHFTLGWLGLDVPWLARCADWSWFRRAHIRINPHDMMIVLARAR